MEDKESGEHTIGITDAGLHAAEGLIIARYMMFTQVYFHKTRVIYDYHLVEAMKELFKDKSGLFPAPTESGVKEYASWDDWRVLGEFASGRGGEHAEILKTRQHYRVVHKTTEIPSIQDLQRFEEVFASLERFGPVKRDAKKSWYKLQDDQIQVRGVKGSSLYGTPLSEISPIVNGMLPVNQRRIYVPLISRGDALQQIDNLSTGK